MLEVSASSSGATKLSESAQQKFTLIRGPLLQGVESYIATVLAAVTKQLKQAEGDDILTSAAAMKVIDGRSSAILSSINQAIDDCFDKLFGKVKEATGLGELSLVALDEIDQQIEVEAAQKLVIDGCGKPLANLLARINAITSPYELFDDENPVAPRIIIDGLADSLTDAELDADSKVLLFSQLAKEAACLAQVYSQLNQLLSDDGVLPELVDEPVQAASTQRERRLQQLEQESSPPEIEQEEGLGLAVPLPVQNQQPAGFSQMQQMLAQQHQPVTGPVITESQIPVEAMPVIRDGVTQVQGQQVNTSSPVVPVDLGALTGMLSQLQKNTGLLEATASGDEEVKGHLAQLMSASSNESGELLALESRDDDVINLISMLFAFVLDDEHIPAAIKALVGKLQIPYLKLAIMDKSLFDREDHAARELLNAMAEAALGWKDDASGSRLVKQVSFTVQKIISEFEADPSIFVELLANFQSYAEEDRKRAEIISRRQMEAAEAQAKMERARESAKKSIAAQVHGRSLPIAILELLPAWEKVLVHTVLTVGEQSAQWKVHNKTIAAMIWSVQPISQPEQREKLKTLAPKILGTLKRGMESIGMDAFEVKGHLASLDTAHKEIQQSDAEDRVEIVVEERVQEEGSAATELEKEGGVEARDDGTARFVLTKPQETSEEDKGQYAEALRQVDALHVNGWLEFRAEGETSRRLKLAAKMEKIDKIIFVNARGIKEEECSRMKLAQYLSLGQVVILDDGKLFDRAMTSVIGNLRGRG